MYAYGNIVIETGATLTITSTIFCDPNTHILVKRKFIRIRGDRDVQLSQASFVSNTY